MAEKTTEDELNKIAETMQGAMLKAHQAREAAVLLRDRLSEGRDEINLLVDVLSKALQVAQDAETLDDKAPFDLLLVGGAAMMVLYSIWHQMVDVIDDADRSDQFYLLRNAFLAIMYDMGYKEPTSDGN